VNEKEEREDEKKNEGNLLRKPIYKAVMFLCAWVHGLPCTLASLIVPILIMWPMLPCPLFESRPLDQSDGVSLSPWHYALNNPPDFLTQPTQFTNRPGSVLFLLSPVFFTAPPSLNFIHFNYSCIAYLICITFYLFLLHIFLLG
jgi:hypothetical protein